MKNKDISLIIPSNHSLVEVETLIVAVLNQSIKPKEILLVESGMGVLDYPSCNHRLAILCEAHNVEFTHIFRSIAFPGKARNLGVLASSGEIIAFADVKTIPDCKWLSDAMEKLEDESVQGVWGFTAFVALSQFECLVRDAFFGRVPRITLPGSVFRRSAMAKIGLFVDWARAGEDTDWIRRVELHRLNTVIPKYETMRYFGLIGMNLSMFVIKWRRNYVASSALPHFVPTRMLIGMVIYPLLAFIAFNWNRFVADWRMDSPFYLDHITKVVVLTPLLFYVLIRSVIIPLRRKVPLAQILPLRFIGILFVCLLADSIKFLAFSIPKRLLRWWKS